MYGRPPLIQVPLNQDHAVAVAGAGGGVETYYILLVDGVSRLLLVDGISKLKKTDAP